MCIELCPSSSFGAAERRAQQPLPTGLPALKKAPAERSRNLFAAAKSRFGPARPASRSDEEELLGSSDESATPELNPPPPPTAQLQQDVGRRGSFGGGGVLRSEVAQGAI